MQAKVLTEHEARQVAVNIARLPESFRAEAEQAAAERVSR